MTTCKSCNNKFSIIAVVDGKRHNLKGRTRCLQCVPLGSSIYKRKSDDEQRTGKALIMLSYYRRKKAEYGMCPITARRNSRKATIVGLIGGCQFCGYNRTIHAIQFHHLRDKKFTIGSNKSFQGNLPDALCELMKCVVVCATCHVEIHHNLISAEIVKSEHERFVSLLEQLMGKTWYELDLGSQKPATKHTCPCGKVTHGKHCSVNCASKAREKVKWPSDLAAIVAQSSLSAVGRALGVSANAVKKRIKNHS